MQLQQFFATDDVESLIRELGPQAPADKVFPEEGGVTVLQWAAESGALACLRFLLSSEEVAARIDEADESGASALLWAAEKSRNTPVLRMLLEKGASLRLLDAGGESALHWAALNGASDALQVLLQQPAAPDMLDVKAANGRTALMNAVLNDHVECVSLLIGAGASKEGALELARSEECRMFFSTDSEKLRLLDANRSLLAENKRLQELAERLREERDEALLALPAVAEVAQQADPHEVDALRAEVARLQEDNERLRNAEPVVVEVQAPAAEVAPEPVEQRVRDALLNLETVLSASIRMTKQSLNIT